MRLRPTTTTTAGLAAALVATLLAVPSASATVPAAVEAPVAVADAVSLPADSSLVVDVLANDTVAAPVVVTLAPTEGIAAPEHGTVTLSSVVVDGVTRPAVAYTPTAGWSGSDSFGYSVTDASGLTADTTVAVTVTPTSSPGHSATLSVATSVIVLRSTTLRGVVLPIDAGLPGVALQNEGAAGWATVATVTPTDTGAWSFLWTARTPGTVRWRAVATWADGTFATSPVARSTVVASADPVVSGPLSRASVPYSYRSGCPVPPSALRRLTTNFYDYAGRVRRGDVVLLYSAVPTVRYVFVAAFAAKFRVKMMIPVDHYYYGGTKSPTTSDILSMNAGNTSAFNCRKVTGSRYRMSQHSYGNAIDVNTFENPYATSSTIYPKAAAYKYYTMRRYHLRDPGVITPTSVVATAFAARHWLWGARWTRHDYQHFSANGG